MGNTVQFIVYDFDGTLTDNTVYVDETGRETVRCHRDDGYAISLLRKEYVRQLILSQESNPIVMRRAAKLNIECISGSDDKRTSLLLFAEREGLDLTRTAYLGNGLNDIDAMSEVEYPIAVLDAHSDIKRIAKHVLAKKGGDGAVLELYFLLKKLKMI